MANVKRSRVSAGSWFVVPLRDQVQYVLGLTVAIPRRSAVEAVFFGPFDHPPTLDDVAQLSPDGAIELTAGVTNYQFRDANLVDGSFPVLGPLEGADVESWFRPLDYWALGGKWIDVKLTQHLVAGWTPVTDPNVLSSWFFVEAGKNWLSATVNGDGVEILQSIFDEVDRSSPVSSELSQIAFGAVELAARVVVVGRWDSGRMAELPDITHGAFAHHTVKAGSWASGVPEEQQRDREFMARLASNAERVLDQLLEDAVWVTELRAADSAVWDAFLTRVDALRTWLRADWVLPKTWTQTLDDIAGSLDEDLGHDVDDVFLPRPVSSGVDASERLAEMSWFHFDDVADWTAGALQTDGLDAVRSALDAALAHGTGDVLTVGVGLAAADIVARLVSDNDGPATTQNLVEQRLRDWVSSNHGVFIDRSDIERARQVVRLACHGQLAEEIDDLDDTSRAAWATLLDSIDHRLDTA